MEHSEYDVEELLHLIQTEDVNAIADFMAKHDLELVENRIVPANKKYFQAQSNFWGQRQLGRKILLNSLYGAILNEGSRYFDPRIGQSVTLSGRCITRHMLSEVNRTADGEYNHKGKTIIYGDTDSVAGDSLIQTDQGPMRIADLFDHGRKVEQEGKEFSQGDLLVLTFDADAHKALYKPYMWVYRHKVSKGRWRITDTRGNAVEATEDHSVMVVRDDVLIEAKPAEIVDGDLLVSHDEGEQVEIAAAHVEEIGRFEDEYVYDVTIDDLTPFFFANNVLVHNSCYFSIAPLRDKEPYASMPWTKDVVLELYDAIAEQVNASFPDMMIRSFHTDREHGEIIAAGRELVASKALYLKKKRYAALIYDLEGARMDVDGKPGKLKAMGVETQRSDTPDFIQKFLSEILLMVLTDKTEEDVIKFVRDFRASFRELPPWRMGRPTSVRGITAYETADSARTVNLNPSNGLGNGQGDHVSGHGRAAMNWNKMLKVHMDRYSTRITDGAKIVVCDLRPNQYGMTSIARPVDQEEHLLPEWFKELPFDKNTMEGKLIDEKIENLIGVLKWNLAASRQNNKFNKFFSF